MNPPEPYTQEVADRCRRQSEEARKRLGLAGSGPESGCRSRAAAEQPDDPLITGSETPLPDQGRGWVQALAARWTSKAAGYRASAEAARKELGSKHPKTVKHHMAAEVYRLCALELLERKPRPQSDAKEVEELRGTECQHGISCWSMLNILGALCPTCPQRGKRMERSGSANSVLNEPEENNS